MTLSITPWICPLCIGGLIGIDEKCLHCSGTGLTNDPMGDAERAPRPPGVMRTACADCALRRGSPELENAGAQLPDAEPFYCHQGVPVSATGAYTPTAMFRGLPLGLMVCAGWWAMQTGEPLPAKEYREVGVGPEQVEQRWGGLARALEDGTLSEQQVDAIIARHLPTLAQDDEALMQGSDPAGTRQVGEFTVRQFPPPEAVAAAYPWAAADFAGEQFSFSDMIDAEVRRLLAAEPVLPKLFIKPVPASSPPAPTITGILSLNAGLPPAAGSRISPAQRTALAASALLEGDVISAEYVAALMAEVEAGKPPATIPDVDFGDRRPAETADWPLGQYIAVACVREFWHATDIIGEPRLTWEEAAEVWDRVQAEQQGGEQP